VQNNTIKLKIFSGALKYWTGTGSYWVFFVIPEGETITHLYMSKEGHYFSTKTTYLVNTDFQPPILLDPPIDISGTLPF